MPIIEEDIKNYLSGGASNSDPNASLGGAISSTQIVDNALHNLFDLVTGVQSDAGITEYRAFFVKNTHATLTYYGAKIYIKTNTTSGDTNVQIALADEIGSPIETIANETIAPVGPAFSDAGSVGAALSIGDLAPGETKGIWVKWSVNAAAVAVTYQATIEVFGDTNP